MSTARKSKTSTSGKKKKPGEFSIGYGRLFRKYSGQDSSKRHICHFLADFEVTDVRLAIMADIPTAGLMAVLRSEYYDGIKLVIEARASSATAEKVILMYLDSLAKRTKVSLRAVSDAELSEMMLTTVSNDINPDGDGPAAA